MTKGAVAAVLGIALAARALAAVPIRFPALDDPAFYVLVARNLAAGRALTVDAVWSYLVPFTGVTHPSNEYWMPLPALALAPAFRIAGPGYSVAQAVGVVLGSLLVLPAMATAAELAPAGLRRSLAVVAGLLAALNPLLIYQSIVPDSAVFFALAASAALLLVGGFTDSDAQSLFTLGRYAAAGFLIGMSYLARTDGLFLVPVGLWYALRRSGRLAAVSAVAAGFLLVAVPWWLRQAETFGSAFPVSALVPALLPDYATLFSWPAPQPSDLAQSVAVQQLLALRWDGLVHNTLGVLLRVLGGVTPLLIAGLAPAWSNDRLRPTLAGAIALFFSSALLFPVVTLHGGYYHSIGGTLPALIGIGSAGAGRAAVWWDTRRGWKRSVLWPLAGGLVALATAQTLLFMGQAAPRHRAWEQEFAAAGAWLQQHPPGVVLTTQPYSLNYATGLPAVMLPAAQPPEAALAVAAQYQARYLVLTEQFGRYPQALSAAPEGFRPVYEGEGIAIYEVSPR